MTPCIAAFNFSGGLNKSIRTNVMEMLFLFMAIPRRCDFTQMGRNAIIIIDVSFIRKAGKHTPFAGTFLVGM